MAKWKWTATLAIPWLGEIEFAPNEAEKRAAWALYVELVTRVSSHSVPNGDGLPREALTSLHSLFAATRAILKEAGPEVGTAPDTVGGLAIQVLNSGLRPFLATWHPILSAFESATVEANTPRATWAQEAEFRAGLADLRAKLGIYSRALGVLAGAEQSFEDVRP